MPGLLIVLLQAPHLSGCPPFALLNLPPSKSKHSPLVVALLTGVFSSTPSIFCPTGSFEEVEVFSEADLKGRCESFAEGTAGLIA